MSQLFLDIATIPDFQLGARLYKLHDLSDKDIARVISTKHRESSNNSDKLNNHLLKVAGLSALLLDEEGIRFRSSVASGISESDQLQFLTDIIARQSPEIIIWDASAVLPVLNYRYLAHAKAIPLSGDAAVIDCMAEISETDEYASLSLQEIALLSGLPGIKPMSAGECLSAYLQGSHESIRFNLELNVVSICLIYQRWLLVCGEIDQASYEKTFHQIHEQLAAIDQTHLKNYVAELTLQQ